MLTETQLVLDRLDHGQQLLTLGYLRLVHLLKLINRNLFLLAVRCVLFKLFFQKLFSQLVVFLYLFVDLVPVAIVEYGQHEVKKQIQPEKEVADEEQDGPIILPVEWEDNIWKI